MLLPLVLLLLLLLSPPPPAVDSRPCGFWYSSNFNLGGCNVNLFELRSGQVTYVPQAQLIRNNPSSILVNKKLLFSNSVELAITEIYACHAQNSTPKALQSVIFAGTYVVFLTLAHTHTHTKVHTLHQKPCSVGYDLGIDVWLCNLAS